MLETFPAAAVQDLHRLALVVLLQEGSNVLLGVVVCVELHIEGTGIGSGNGLNFGAALQGITAG
jgi:hypothetical protein